MLNSGYFLSQKKFHLRNIFKLWLEVWFYSMVIGIICFATKIESFSLQGLVKMCFPFTFNEYWFFSTYIVIYLFFPYLNKLIHNLTRKQHQGIIVIGVFLFSFLYTVAKASWLIGSNSIAIFIVLYFIGAYFNRYEVCVPKYKIIPLAVLFIILEIGSVFFMRIVYRYTELNNFSYLIWGTEKILPIITSTTLFLFFQQVKLKHVKMIAFLSPSIFGVYLFHIGHLKNLLFKDIFNN